MTHLLCISNPPFNLFKNMQFNDFTPLFYISDNNLVIGIASLRNTKTVIAVMPFEKKRD